METVVLNLLTKHLGDYDSKKGKNYAFHCPFCNHYKKKLEVNLENGLWNCWVCHKKGFSVTRLFSQLKIATSDIQLVRQNERYVKHTGDSFLETKDVIKLELPKEYEPFNKVQRSFLSEKAARYLLSRNLSQYEILKYKIGFCHTGKYQDCIIVPSYNSEGQLNYFVAKNVHTGKYTNPDYSKDQVIFDLFINWEYDIILVEGVFDAFAVKHNVVPLLGKIMSKQLKQKLSMSNVKKVYICLDGDQKEDCIRIAEYLQSIGIKPYIVKLPDNEDPSSLGYKKIWELIKNTVELRQEDLFLEQIKLRW
jgi:DNA primase